MSSSDGWVHPDINWFPGHMLKARKELAGQLKRVDVVLEVRDARIPQTSIIPDFEELIRNKRRVVLLNKSRLAEPQVLRTWEQQFSRQADAPPLLVVDVLENRNLKRILPLARSLMKDRWETFKRRGIRPPELRLMVVGIPNVGKSTLINRLVKRKATETGPRPGVTKRQEWVKLDRDAELLDTPGILWPKIESEEIGLRLAITGAIKDAIVGQERLGAFLLQRLQERHPEAFDRYGLDEDAREGAPHEVLTAIADARKCLKEGGELDLYRASEVLLSDFRSGRLGPLSLDLPDPV